MKNLNKEKVNKGQSEKEQEYVRTSPFNAQEFCSALVLSRQLNGNIKHFNMQNSREELAYSGGLYEDYKNLQLVINKDRDYKSKVKSNVYNDLTDEDLALIKSTISQFESLNGIKERASVPFTLEAFIKATNELLKGDKPIIYYSMAHSGELGYFRSYACDYKIVVEILNGKDYSKTRSQKGIKEALSQDDIAYLKDLYFNGYFFNRLNKPKNVRKVRSEGSSVPPLDLTVFAEAFKKYKELDGSYTLYNVTRSKNELGYPRSFSSDFAKVSAFSRGQLSIGGKMATDEDISLLKQCGFLEYIRSSFDVDAFLSIIDFMQQEYGNDFFAHPKRYVEEFGEDNLHQMFGYTRKFLGDYKTIRDIFEGNTARKYTTQIPGVYEALDTATEIRLLPMVSSHNKYVTQPFNIKNYIKVFCDNSLLQVQKIRAYKEFGRDFNIDAKLVEDALRGYPSPEYVLKQLTQERRITLMNMSGKNKNAVSRLSEFFKAWDNFIEIPAHERDYRDFYEDLSLEILDYNYSFSEDYTYIANLYIALSEDVNNQSALGALKPYNISAQEFLDFANAHNFNVERQYKRKKADSKAKTKNNKEVEK